MAGDICPTIVESEVFQCCRQTRGISVIKGEETGPEKLRRDPMDGEGSL